MLESFFNAVRNLWAVDELRKLDPQPDEETKLGTETFDVVLSDSEGSNSVY